MKVRAALGLCGAVMTFAGCTAPSTSTTTAPAVPDLTGNWQIQSTVDPGTVPPSGIVLFGALQSSGNQVSGTFRFANLGQPTQCGLDQVVTVNGAMDSKNSLTLTSSTMPNGTAVKTTLTISGLQQRYTGAGTIEVNGSTCTFASTGATGLQIQNTSGTFTGTLTPGTLLSPGTGPSATVSLALTQAQTPQGDGQFPASGTLSYAVGACSGSVKLTGTVSGVGVILSTTTQPSGTAQNASFLATSNSGATAITAGVLDFTPAPCSADTTSSAIYTGAVSRN